MLSWLRKSGTYSISQLAGLAGWIGWGTATGAAVNERTALDLTAVFCGARVIAEGIAQMPVRIMAVGEDSPSGLPTWQARRDHWAHRLLAVRPNGWQTSYEFREGMIFNAVLGEGALAIKNVVNGEVRELLPVPVGSWSVEQRSDWTLQIRVDYSDKSHEHFELGQVFYVRGPSLDGFKALPAVRQAREAIGLSQALERQQAKLAANGGKPSGVLSFAEKLSPDSATKLRETWQERFGPNGDGGIAVLDGSATFSPITMTGIDAQSLEQRRLQVEEIARALRVQPIMLMQADKAATYASAEQMFRMHVIHTLGPWIERFEQAANRDILNNETGLTVDLDERNLLRGDFKDQAEYYTRALGAGGQPAWMTVNEIRAEIGLNPMSEGWTNEISRGAMNPEGGNDGTQDTDR
jgi:HK97 family phage portal protein